MKFGESLLKTGLITGEELQNAVETQRFRKIKLGRLLRDLGVISQGELNHHLGVFLRPELSSIQSLVDDLREKMTLGQFTQEELSWAEDHEVTLYQKENHGLTYIATHFRDEVLEAAESKFKKPSTLRILSEDGYRFLRGSCNLNPAFETSNFAIDRESTDEQKIAGSDPYTSLFRDTILAARKLSASDIHIQPTRDGIDIRFRVNGDLTTWKQLSIEHRRSFVNCVKRLTNLSIAISGRAQDGRISFKSWQLDLRASLLPSQYGEKIVLRLLDLSRKFELSALGFDTTTNSDLREALAEKNGLIIISGPTGSGKTTTLYTLLCELDRTKKNVITLEDPIEYGIEGLTQVQVSKKLSFADSLRAVLRQDPDVILVGEIRDAETADLCIKAASTGHLVLTTLHANGASEVIDRLINLGIGHFMLKSVLRFSSAQRLVKKLCKACSIRENKKAFELIQKKMPNAKFSDQCDFRRQNTQGCKNCQDGITGRTPVLEYLRSNTIREYMSPNKCADPRPTISLKEAAFKRAEKGEIDFYEINEIE